MLPATAATSATAAAALPSRLALWPIFFTGPTPCIANGSVDFIALVGMTFVEYFGQRFVDIDQLARLALRHRRRLGTMLPPRWFALLFPLLAVLTPRSLRLAALRFPALRRWRGRRRWRRG